MMNGFVHADQHLAVHRFAISSNNAGYATHVSSFILPAARRPRGILGEAVAIPAGAAKLLFLPWRAWPFPLAFLLRARILLRQRRYRRTAECIAARMQYLNVHAS